MESPPQSKVIVFGATGAVGSAAAKTAHDLGAHVTLAMRDTSKRIPGIDDPSSSSTYAKVTADLTQPHTVKAAVQQSGATHAFLYLAHGSADGMRGAIDALHAGGIRLVVFLSSFSVTNPVSEIPRSDFLARAHGDVEANLAAAFGPDGFVALRPGYFASNEHALGRGVARGGVKLAQPHTNVDCIAPADIGRVAGTVLAQGAPEDGNRAIYLFGPRLLAPREVMASIARVLRKTEPTVIECDAESARQVFVEERGYPGMLADYFVGKTHGGKKDGPGEMFGQQINRSDWDNVAKYGGGRPPMEFEAYVRENKERFLP